MPKKFAAENSKAVEARERKKNTKLAAENKKQRDEEDAYWQDNDKQIQKKQLKKEMEEKKRLEALQRKAEAKVVLEKEMGEISKKTTKQVPASKLTRAQIGMKVTQQKPEVKTDRVKIVTHLDEPLVENVNRLEIDGEEARNVDEAIMVLSSKPDDSVDKHPEKRMKALYSAFEERRLSELKISNPSLRLSQLKQMIFKEWQKSPENPLNNQ